MTTTVTSRTLQRVIEGLATSDGAGVKLRRTLGQGQGTRLDPFLMLDEFSSENPGDYIAGFPAHPHRGFETAVEIAEGGKVNLHPCLQTHYIRFGYLSAYGHDVKVGYL